MRKITEQTCKAFRNCQRKKLSNSEVIIKPSGNAYYELYGNLIAMYSPRAKELMIKDCGRQTQTTLDRLNGILTEFQLGAIVQRHGVWYYTNGITNERWTGTKIFNFSY